MGRLLTSSKAAKPACVLHELRVENLLLIERAELNLAPGLNVLTGETGAGKTVLTQALNMLLGGRPKGGAVVRPGASEAYVEGVFDLSEDLKASLVDHLPEDAEELVLARRISSEGRSRAYLCGRSVGVGELGEVAAQLVSFYGQHEHRKLTVAAVQLGILDAFCGAKQLDLIRQIRQSYTRLKELERRSEQLRSQAAERERELDLLRFELDEIETVAPTAGEELDLQAERDRLRNLEGLRAAALGAATVVESDEAPGTIELLGGAGRELAAMRGTDSSLDPLIDRYEAVLYELSDLVSELQTYERALEADPSRLEQIEVRLEQIGHLKRKHGDSVEDVLDHAAVCRERIAELENSVEAAASVGTELTAAEREFDLLATTAKDARKAAVPELVAAVKRQLAELAMPQAEFSVELTEREERGSEGTDRAEFMLAANPGVAPGPLREIASGGELSRVMLALLSTANGTGESTLVFDEIDAGVGGHTARAVGSHLGRLANSRQLICITHLPQVAAFADRHFKIEKEIESTPAVTTVNQLDGGAVLDELVRMLGADSSDTAARKHVKELIAAK